MPFAKFEPDSDEEGFINKIKDDYFEETNRLVFADFLEERGDPRGPYMRFQIELHKLQREEDDRRKRHPSSPMSIDKMNRQNNLIHKIHELHNEHAGAWFGPLWWAAARGASSHRFVHGMMRICGSPASFAYLQVQKALAWADSIQIDHDAGGVTALEKLFERNQICCVAFSNYTVMMETLKLRFLRWLHCKSRRLPSRIVSLELGQSVTQEAFDLIATLPNHVLDQVQHIQAGSSWNRQDDASICADALAKRSWGGRFDGRT